MRIILVFMCCTLLAQDAQKSALPNVEQLQAQLAAKDAELQQWKQYSQEVATQNAKLMTLLQGFLGQMPQPPSALVQPQRQMRPGRGPEQPK